MMSTALKGNTAGGRALARTWLPVLCALLTACWISRAQQSLSLGPGFQSAGSADIWEHGVGEGFRCGAQALTLSAGGAYGVQAIGSEESHDLVLGSVTYGRMLDNTMGEHLWYGGNFELRVQLFGGTQFSPRDEYVVGLTPHLRYDFATGTRWVPFFDLGAGVTATGIREPDLGGVFEFNLQAIVGVQRFLTDRTALTLEAGYLHISSAGIYEPNSGVNCVTGMVGVSFFF